MRRLKSIDEIYDEVKDYGLVITNDAPLETALNSRIKTARIGKLAYTPRHIAMQLGPLVLGRPFMSELELISAVSEETGLGLRHVYSEIMNLREIRTHTSDVGAYINTRNARLIYESYRRMPTLEKAMSDFDVEDEDVSWFFKVKGGVAVICPELLNDLDKHFNPLDCDIVDIFTDDNFTIDTIHEIGNDRQLAENAAELILGNDPNDFAIVLNSAGPIADAVRASLYRRRIPFINSLNVKDLAQIRDYLSFLSLALSYSTLRVKDVKELYSNYNGFFNPGHEEYLLSKQGPMDMKDRATELKDVMQRIFETGMTFGEVKDIICNNQARPQVTLLLEELKMVDRTVTPDQLSEVRFAVENVQNLKHNEQIPDDERTGVLLADSKNSVFVDRPVVIYLGMEQEWNIPVIGKRYYDPETEAENNAIRLEALVQQGQKRVYCVNSFKNGNPAKPCLTFDLIDKGYCGGFDRMCGNLEKGRWTTPTEPFIPEKGAIDVDGQEFDKPFSKSSFDAYVACPRKYMFDNLLPSSDATTTEFGNLIHEFAELYVNYRELVLEKGVDHFVTLISDRYTGLSTPLMEQLDTEKIRMAMRNVMRYIDLLGVKGDLNVSNDTKRTPNRFLKELGLPMTSDICETDHRSVAHPMHGVFDLYCNGVITDYKTGKPKKPSDIKEEMNIGKIAKYPEFQPLMYLALAREADVSSMKFNLFYAMDNDVTSLDEDYDIRNSVRTVRIVDKELIEYLVESEEAAAFMDDVKKGYEGHGREYLQTLLLPHPANPSEWRSDDEMCRRILSVVGKSFATTNIEAVRPIVNRMAGLVTGGMPVMGSEILVPMRTLDDFLSTLDSLHDTAMRQVTTELPPMPAGAVECKKCKFYEACTRVPVGNEADGGDSDE